MSPTDVVPSLRIAGVKKGWRAPWFWLGLSCVGLAVVANFVRARGAAGAYVDPVLLPAPKQVHILLSSEHAAREGWRQPGSITGLHGPEPFGQWTSGPTAVIDGVGPVHPGATVEVCASAFPPSVGIEGRIVVGVQVERANFTANSRCIEIRYSGARPADRIKILDYPVGSPKSLGISEDYRELGLAIHSITIKEP